MQSISPKHTTKSLQLPASHSPAGNVADGNRVRRINRVARSSPRPRSTCTCLNRPGSIKCSYHGYVVPSEKLRRQQANKEIVRRALTPPNRRLALRWLNFQPTPSRLSNMSMA